MVDSVVPQCGHQGTLTFNTRSPVSRRQYELRLVLPNQRLLLAAPPIGPLITERSPRRRSRSAGR